MSSANWSTELLAEYLGQHPGIRVTEEMVRVYLHANGYGGLRPTCTDASQSGRASGLRGKRLRVEVVLIGASAPEPLPVRDLIEADLWSQLPADVAHLLALLPRADLYLQDEVQFAFHPCAGYLILQPHLEGETAQLAHCRCESLF